MGAAVKSESVPVGDDGVGVGPQGARHEVVALDALVDNERNPRGDLRDLGGLVASIRGRGVVQALTVTDLGLGRFLIVAGHRRAAAARLAGLAVVPCTVLPGQGRGAADDVLDALVENVHRDGLSQAEQVAGVRQLVVDLGMSAKAVGEATGVGVAVARRLARVARDPGASRSLAGGLDLEQALVVAEWAGDQAAQDVLVAAAEQGRSAFERQAGALRGDRAVAAMVADLREAGVDAHDEEGWEQVVPQGAVRLTDLRDVDGERLDVVAHAGCPGHAEVVVLTWRAAEPGRVPWCTDPGTHGHTVPSWLQPDSAHPGDGSGVGVEEGVAVERARQERRRVIRCNRGFRAARLVRVAHVAGLLKRRTAPKATLDVVVRLVAAGAHNDCPTTLAEMLGVSPDPGSYRPQGDLLRTWLGDTPTDARRTLGLLAVAGSWAEQTALADGAWRHPSPDGVAAGWLGWLSSTGYDPGPVEQLAVGLLTTEQVDAIDAGE